MIFGEAITLEDEKISRLIPGDAAAGQAQPETAAFIEKLRAHDAAAFDLLVERYSGDVYGLLYRLTENAEEARDLTQDVFLRAFRAIGSFRGDAALRTWLFRIAVNESRNRFRWWKRRRRDAIISLDADLGGSDLKVADTIADDSIGPEEAALMREREYVLSVALSELPALFREAVVLCDVQGLSYEETAAALGISIGTVKSRISRGREALRRKLKDL